MNMGHGVAGRVLQGLATVACVGTIVGCHPMVQPMNVEADLGATDSSWPQPLRPGDPSLGTRIAGHVAVLDFWATWCEPCRETIPKVIRLADAYGPEGLVVVGVHVGRGSESATAFAEDAGIQYPLYTDEDYAFSDRFGARSVPTVLVVAPNGSIVHRSRELDAEVLAAIREQLTHVKNTDTGAADKSTPISPGGA